MARVLCFAVAVALAVVAAKADPNHGEGHNNLAGAILKHHLAGALLKHHLEASSPQGHGPHGQAPQGHHTLAGAILKHHLAGAIEKHHQHA
ncbi:hypothetical protein FOCC_FOCC004499, partial [Frankliniella occidentalis]